MSRLKPKVKAFGFNNKELKGLAAKIADNLDSEEEASEEDVNAEIDEAIEAVLPALELGRSYANRVINNAKNGNEENPEDKGEDDGNQQESNLKSSKTSKTKEEKSAEVPNWAKTLIESNKSLSAQIEALKGEKLTDTRRSRLEKLVKDTGTFGSLTLKSFTKMKFEDDDDFDEYLSGVEEDLKNLNQERSNAGLALFGSPAAGGSSKKDSKPEVLSEDEIKAIAQM